VIDPYAKAVEGPIDGTPANALPLRAERCEAGRPICMSTRQTASRYPESVVVDPSFVLRSDRPAESSGARARDL